MLKSEADLITDQPRSCYGRLVEAPERSHPTIRTAKRTTSSDLLGVGARVVPLDVERWMKRWDDRLLNVSRGRVLPPGHKQVPDHPLRQPPLVVVDQDD